jgi:hypothetical protein
MMAHWQNETLSAILYHLFMVTWCKQATDAIPHSKIWE